MKSPLLIVSSFFVLLTSCFTPINLTFDSARNIKKGQMEVQTSYSKYGIVSSKEYINTNLNYGGRVTYGISDRLNIKFRYERLKLHNPFSSFTDFPVNLNVNYFEAESKIELLANRISVGIPIGYYFYSNCISCDYLFLDPRAYFTFFGSSNKIDLSLIPKMHIRLTSEKISVFPAFSIGLGLSNNLRKWALRPEIGYDFGLSLGVGLQVNLSEMFLLKK